MAASVAPVLIDFNSLPVSALCVTDGRCTLAASGSTLHVYTPTRHAPSPAASARAFSGSTSDKISALKWGGANGEGGFVLVIAPHRIALVYVALPTPPVSAIASDTTDTPSAHLPPQLRICAELTSPEQLSPNEWIWDAALSPTSEVIIGYANNFVERWTLPHSTAAASAVAAKPVRTATMRCPIDCGILTTLRLAIISQPAGSARERVIVCCGSVYSEIVVWEYTTAASASASASASRVLCRMRGHSGVIHDLALVNSSFRSHTNHSYLCSASDDRSVRVWKFSAPLESTDPATDLATATATATAPATATSAALPLTAESVATHFGHTSRVWRVTTTAHQPVPNRTAAADAKSQPVPFAVLSASEDGTCKVWTSDAHTNASGGSVNSSCVATYAAGARCGGIWSIAVDRRPGGGESAIVAGTVDGAIVSFPHAISPPPPLVTHSPPEKEFIRLICDTGSVVVAACSSGMIYAVDTRSGEWRVRFRPAPTEAQPPIYWTALAANGGLIVAGDKSGRVYLLASADAKSVPPPVVHTCAVSDIFIEPIPGTDNLRLFSCDVMGGVRVFTIAAADRELPKPRISIQLPASGGTASGALTKVTAVASLTAENDTQFIVCGDSRGSVHLFALVATSAGAAAAAAAAAMETSAELCCTHAHVHHTDQVTSLAALHPTHIFSTARDGRVVEYRIAPVPISADSKQPTAAVAAATAAFAVPIVSAADTKASDNKPARAPKAKAKAKAKADRAAEVVVAGVIVASNARFQLVPKRVISCSAVPITERVFWSGRDMCVAGFQTTAFVAHNIDADTEIARYECGGGNRSFAFTAASNAHVFRYNTTASIKSHAGTSSGIARVVRAGSHSRLTTGIEAISGFASPSLWATGSEDGTVKLHELTSAGGFRCRMTLTDQPDIVRCIAAVPERGGTEVSALLFAAGGKEHIHCYRIRPSQHANIPYSVDSILSSQAKSSPAASGDAAVFDARIMSIAAVPLTAGSYGVAVGTSTGHVKCFSFDTAAADSKLHGTSEAALNSPVLSLAVLKADNSHVLFAGTNDGQIRAYHMTPTALLPLISVSMHACGVNAIAVTPYSQAAAAAATTATAAASPPAFVMVSASDDQSIGVMHFNVDAAVADSKSSHALALSAVAVRQWKNAHSASVTALRFAPPTASFADRKSDPPRTIVASAGQDQILRLWCVEYQPPALRCVSRSAFELSDCAALNISSNSELMAVLAGQGMQAINISPNNK